MITRIVLLPLALLVLVACSTPSTGPAPAVDMAPRPSAVQASLTSAEVAFVERARQVAPQIVGSDERLASRAANTCSSLSESGKPRSWVVDQAVARFSSGSYTVTRGEAEQLVDAARDTVCAG